MAPTIIADHFWLDKSRFDNAEREYYERLSKVRKGFCDEKINILKDMKTRCGIDKSRYYVAERMYYEYVSKVKGVQDNELKIKSSSVTFDEQNIQSSDGVNIGYAAAHQQVVKTGKYKKSKKKALKEVVEMPSPNEVQFAKENITIASEAKVIKSRNKIKSSKKVVDGTSVGHGQYTTKMQSSYGGDPFSSKSPYAKGSSSISQCTLVSEIAKAREHIKNSLEKMDGIANLAASPISPEVIDRVSSLEKDNTDLKKLIKSLESMVLESQQRISALEGQLAKEKNSSSQSTADANAKKLDDDDGVDLFASESEDENEEAARLREERLAAYAAKKSKKPALIAKSSLVLDVKPWDDETDLTKMETEIRKITADGLLWGASKFVPVAFGIKKISISCVVEDEKVSIDWLTEEIEKLEDYVQSVDVAAFNKI